MSRFIAAWLACLPLASCGASLPATPTRGAAAPDLMAAAAVARSFWIAVAAADVDRAASCTSYPFDLDTVEACLSSEEELKRALREDLRPDLVVVVGEVTQVTLETTGLDEHWTRHLSLFLADDAKCVTREDGAAYFCFLVEFTVNGDREGSLTRVRCHGADCRVAGIDN